MAKCLNLLQTSLLFLNLIFLINLTKTKYYLSTICRSSSSITKITIFLMTLLQRTVTLPIKSSLVFNKSSLRRTRQILWLKYYRVMQIMIKQRKQHIKIGQFARISVRSVARKLTMSSETNTIYLQRPTSDCGSFNLSQMELVQTSSTL